MRAAAEKSDASEHGWVAAAVAGLADAVIVVDRNRELVYANPAATRVLLTDAWSPDPERWCEEYGILESDEKTPFCAEELPLCQALRGVEAPAAALFVRNAIVPGGVHILGSASALRDADGVIVGAACIFRNITPLRQREAALRETERQRKAILDNIPDIAWLKDDRGRFLVVNQRFAEAAGRKRPEEIVGLTDLDLYPPELAERYRGDDAEVMRSGLHFRTEEPFVDANGKALWIETVKTRIVDDGKVIGTTGIAHDITDRRRAEDAMRSTNDELERRVLARTAELAEAQENLVRQERLAILGQLAGGVAHQIRNPLAAIMNAAYVLKRHVSPGQHPNVEDAIRIIHDEVRHANIIITGLLDYARVRTPDRHPASIVELVERILGFDWIPANVRVIRTLPTDDAVVREVDADQLQGAIANLVRNAIDAMPDGGELRASLALEDGEVVLTIADTGSGISPQLRAHLFEPLHSTKPMGVGLGLVTARRFVEAHGGTIASIDVAHGACFEIRLPG